MIKRMLSTLMFCIFNFASCFAAAQNDPHINDVLSYWFGDLKSAEDYPQQQSNIWWEGSDDIDQEIRDRFGKLVNDAASHKLDGWKKTPKGRLALIILVDQFSRNIYRGTPQAFSSDPIARELTLEGINLGDDLKLFPIERAFFYLPLEHTEDLKVQELSVAKYKKLMTDAPASLTPIFQTWLDHAQQHYEIIKEFGRFPYRNEVLGRKSTAEELKFLEDPDASF